MDKAQKLIKAAGSLRAAPQSAAALYTTLTMLATATDKKKPADLASRKAAPKTTKCACGLRVAAAAAATIRLLNAAGFSDSGVISKSLAASVNSAIGNVNASSGFATLQSAGAGGTGFAYLNSASQSAEASVNKAKL